MKQAKKGSKMVSRSTMAFTNSMAEEIAESVSSAKDAATAEPASPEPRSEKPLAKSGLRRRSPLGKGRMVERLGSYVVEKRLAATESVEIYRCVNAVTGAGVLAKVLRADNLNPTGFVAEVARAKAGGLKGLHFVSHGECPAGLYYLVEDDGDDQTVNRLTSP